MSNPRWPRDARPTPGAFPEPAGPEATALAVPRGTVPAPPPATQLPPVAPVATPAPAHLAPPTPAAVPIAGGSAPLVAPLQPPHAYVGSPAPSHAAPPGPALVPRPPQTTAHYPTGALRITVQYPQVGTVLHSPRGQYTVRDIIGAGEFGAVYECIGPFDQVYAVKMVRPANRPYVEVQTEWAKEVSRLFTLRHPNVVYIYDSFEENNLFYLALERCDHALKAMLGAPMQEGLVLEMTRQLLAAVQFLHDNDVVHDDLHAGNVLITHAADRPIVKISDFGISEELRGAAAIRPNVVHHAIMAPEILATGYTSRQSDLYQVGLLVYWMLTGEPAMRTDVPYADLVRQVADGEPRRRAEALGTPTAHVIAKMLRRREAFRYASPREVWAELRELPAWQARDLFPAR